MGPSPPLNVSITFWRPRLYTNDRRLVEDAIGTVKQWRIPSSLVKEVGREVILIGYGLRWTQQIYRGIDRIRCQDWLIFEERERFRGHGVDRNRGIRKKREERLDDRRETVVDSKQNGKRCVLRMAD